MRTNRFLAVTVALLMMLSVLPLSVSAEKATKDPEVTIYGIAMNDRIGDLTGQWISLQNTDPATATGYGPTPVEADAAAYANGIVYGWMCDDYGDYYFFMTTPNDFSTSIIGIECNYSILDMTYDYVTEAIYATCNNKLLKIDISPAGVTDVTEIGNFTTPMLTIAIDEDGVAYGNGMGQDNDKLYRINLETAETTLIGQCEITIPSGSSACQSLCYDFNNHELYWMFVSMNESELYTLDRETGAIVRDCGFSIGQVMGMFTIPDFDPVDREDAVTGIDVTPSVETIRVGYSTDLDCTVFPLTAANRNVTWSVDDESIATVDQNGVVTGVSEGLAMVSVTTEDGDFTDFALIEVRTGELVKGYYFESQEEANEWTVNDADGDGYNWFWSNDPGMRTYEGEGLMTSESYSNSLGDALDPDNWLISPAFVLNGATDLSFYYAGQSIDYYDENFGVYITTDNGQNWESLGDYVSEYEYQRAIIDLSDYTGNTVKIAFRHYDSCDYFMLNLDQIEFWGAAELAGSNPPQLGDIDGNGSITTNDALMIIRYSVEVLELTGPQILLADVTQDGNVNLQDALVVLRQALGL